MSTKTLVISLAVTIIVGVLIVSGFEILGGKINLNTANKPLVLDQATTSQSVAVNPTNELQAGNLQYIAAQSAWSDHNYALALQDYQNALLIETDPVQRGQIEYLIGKSYEALGNYADAVGEYKLIAADRSVGSVLQAYAIEQMGIMFNSNFGSKKMISDATFSGTPYSGFLQNGDYNLAYRRLYEYAATFYPLGYAEGNIAEWYANDLISNLHGATTTSQGRADVVAAQNSLRLADQDVAATLQDPISGTSDPSIVTQEGYVTELLASVGVGTFAQAEAYYSLAVQYLSRFNESPASFVSYSYAVFLSHEYGTSRANDIRTVLAPFHAGATDVYANVQTFFTTIRTNKSYSTNKQTAVRLANIAPDFKTYLESIGWQPTDFATTTGA